MQIDSVYVNLAEADHMGRPQDKFCWENVEKLSDSKWRCKHCKGEFSGSANRIRIHLSGEGFGIRSCKAVPSHIREEAILNKGTDSKRARYSSSVGGDIDPNVMSSTMINNSSEVNYDSLWMILGNDSTNVVASAMGTNVTASTTSNDVTNGDNIVTERLSSGDNIVTESRENDQDPIPCSSGGDPNLLSVQDAELYVTGALVKSLLLKSNNLSVDFIKDPNFRTFLERVRQYGVPASLLGDDTPMIEKSLMSYKEEVRQYISEVKESWKITGCTMMVYNLNQKKGVLSDFDKDNYVSGFYSPKGFIFFEDVVFDRPITASSRLLFPTDLTSFILHDYDDDHICELVDPSMIYLWDEDIELLEGVITHPCLRQEIQKVCSKICERSEWLKGMFNKAEKIHQHIDDSDLCGRYRRTLKKKKLKAFEDGKQTSPPSSFVSIMLLEEELKTWLPNPICYAGSLEEAEIEATLNDSEFWLEGRQVQRALNLILEIPDLIDTLVPSAGYFKLAFDHLRRELNPWNRPHTPMLDQFWVDLDCELSDLYKEFCRNEDLGLSVSLVMKWSSGYNDEEELQRHYLGSNNPFANISQQERENTHPIKLWEKYGHAFPQLQKCAIKALSGPVSCLCNQVKKHMSELQGADDLILRLNARMMEEFRNLGDDIYKPIDYKQIVHW